MNTGHEVDTPATDDPTPLPPLPAGAGRDAPTPESVLRAIAASSGPWFASTFATHTDTPRDTLDEPLSVLRLAGLVRVDAWVRNVGQGYVLTSLGTSALTNPALLKPRTPAETPSDEIPTEVPKVEPERVVREQPAVIDTRLPLVTPVVVGVNLLWFFVGLVVAMRLGIGTAYLNGGAASVAALDRVGAVSGFSLVEGQWWRLLSSCFVHIGWLHLLGNMLALGMMGPVAELMWGRGRLFVIYAVSGLAGSCLAMSNRPESMLAGASGAIWGVQMALVAWVLLFRAHLPGSVVSEWYRRLGVVFIINGGVSLLPNVSWEAHLGGGVAGFVAAGLLNAVRFGDRKRRVAAVVLLLLLPVLCVGGLMMAMKNSDVWKPLRQRAAAVRATERAAAFNRDVAPVLDELAPHLVQPLQNEARLFLLRDPARRKADAAAIRQRVVDIHDRATFALSRLEGPPSGDAAFDTYRERAKAFATKRAESFEVLRRMIDANTLPDEAAWAAWGALRRAADQLWAALR